MKMKIVKKTDNYTVLRRNNGRYAVIGSSKNAINGSEKVRILLEEELIVAKLPEENAAAGLDEKSDSDVSEASIADSVEDTTKNSGSDENVSDVESTEAAVDDSGVEVQTSDKD